MRNSPNLKIEKYRVTDGDYGTHQTWGNNGMFLIPFKALVLRVVCSDGCGWDHLSVSIEGVKRCPHWDEMKHVAELFFRDDEWSVQFHPSRKEYVNNHEWTLHIWRPQHQPLYHPPFAMVGSIDNGPMTDEQLRAAADGNIMTQAEMEDRHGIEYPVDEFAVLTAGFVCVVARMALKMSELTTILPSLEEETQELMKDATTLVGLQSRLAHLFNGLDRIPPAVRNAIAPILEKLGELET